ncbi:MAG: ankyrin repeat domain-containing protein [Rickettsiales bacterium]|nr:ankyrin repeat domain-containing protein [Rickettsiales bacterium]
MHKKNKNNAHFQKVAKMFPWMMIAAFMPTLVAAQGLPALPPLPPLPGMQVAAPELASPPAVVEAPAIETPVAANPEVPQMPPLPAANDVASEDMFAVPELPAGNDIAMPDFGLFDPAALPVPPEGATVAQAAPELPDMPELEAPVVNPDAEIADMLEAPELPALPAIPSFSETAAVPDIEMAKPANADAVKEPEGVADLGPPELPDEKPISSELADMLPSWMTDEALPSLKPLPQDRQKEEKVATKPPVKKVIADKELDDGTSLADLIDKEINSGDVYDEDGADLGDIASDGDSRRVVWPRNFKTQKLPPRIYHKQYSNANRHLPHAMYKKEIEAHMFGAVGANDADAVRAILRTGVPISLVNTKGEDLAMHAVKAGATTTLQLVLALGANPSHQDRYGATPLHRAVFLGRQDMVTILLRAGANSYVNDMSGVTPMAIAVARRDQPMMQTLGYYQATGKSAQRMAKYQPY